MRQLCNVSYVMQLEAASFEGEAGPEKFRAMLHLPPPGVRSRGRPGSQPATYVAPELDALMAPPKDR